MTHLSERLGRVKPSPTMAATARAAEMKAEGVDVISLTVGEPDFPTPDHIIDAATRAMRDGKTRYTRTDGTPELKAAIAEKFARDNGMTVAQNEISVGAGAKQVIYNALMATVGAGDEVIIPVPGWVSYIDMVELAEGTPVVVQCPANQGFKLTPDRLRKIVTDRSRWLMLNSPCNPSGAVYSAEELAALAEVVRAHPSLMVMCDDIYEHIIFDDLPFATMAQVAPDLRNRTLTVNGVSKAYAMTGFRIGYGAGPADLIRAMATMCSQTTTNPCSVSQAAAVAALTGPQDLVHERSDAFEARRDRVVARLNEIDGLRCSRPDGAFYVFPACDDLIGRTTPDGSTLQTDTDVCDFLLDEAHVATVPGAAFGLSPFIRISIAAGMETLDTALDRIAEAIARLT